MFKINLAQLQVIINNYTNYAINTVLTSLIEAFLVYKIWNFLFPAIITAINTISYAQAFLLIILIRVITQSWATQNLMFLVFQLLNSNRANYNLDYSFYQNVLNYLQTKNPKQEDNNNENKEIE